MNIVLFGPPGAGKGTQSALIAEKFNLAHLSTGDLFRSAIKAKTDLGIKAKAFMDKGELVPDSITIGLIKEEMKKNKKSGVLFDGFPRNTAQAAALDEYLKTEKQKIDRAIFLEVDSEILKDRLTGRRVCTKCGTAFHVTMKPPRVPMVCDNCGSPLEQRSDDHGEVIQNRLEVYNKNTAPLKSYYKDAGKFVLVDGVGDPTMVFDRVSQQMTS